MLPFADTHVHLLAGRDDGPRDWNESLAMARLMVAEGTRYATALAHQNPAWPDNEPQELLSATAQLRELLKQHEIPLQVFPTGEVMLTPQTLQEWHAGKLLSYGHQRKHVLVEMPSEGFVDIRNLAMEFARDGVRIVLAHAERYEELIDDIALMEETVQAGVLIQLTTCEIAEPVSARHERAMKQWAQRGMVHVLGSDGHQMGWRQPHYKAGYDRLAKWTSADYAERVAGIWGPAILQGMLVQPPAPSQRKASWWSRWFGG